jgi:ketosteroid isomerase-like protein
VNDAQNRQDSQKKFTMPRNLIWGGAVAAIVIAFVLFLVVFMSSSETPTAFLVKWKSALETGDPKRYEALWVKSARQRPDTGYQRTVKLLRDNVNFEVNLGGASQPYRVPRYTNRFRIEAIPLTVYFPGEAQQQKRNLVIEKKGIIQQRWKIVTDEIVGSELAATLPTSDFTQETRISEQPNSPVVPLVIAWKGAVESQDLKQYTDLWDKSARKKRAASFGRATELMSQIHVVDLAGATYTAVPRHKNRHLVDNIHVTLQNGGDIIATHIRTLTIEKKGFFRRKWKLINDQIGVVSDAIALASDVSGADTVSGEESGGTFDGNAPLDTHLKVRQVLGKWQTAWEEKDLQTYMSIYSERSRITRVNVRGGKETKVHLSKGQLRTKMKKLNTIYADIQVSISNLQVNGDRAVADVKFLQKFTGTPASGSRPAYSDYGTKRLNLMVDPTDGHWRIYSETWSRYEDVPEFPKM